MTVFVVHGVRDDISPARKFGPLLLVNHAYIHGDELEREGDDNVVPSWCIARINTAASMFDPVNDFLLIAGDHLQLLAMTAILTVRFGTFMVLRYDRQLNDYIPVRLHSGLVPSPTVMVESGTHIGEQHGETTTGPRHPTTASEIHNLETPLTRFDYETRTGKRSP